MTILEKNTKKYKEILNKNYNTKEVKNFQIQETFKNYNKILTATWLDKNNLIKGQSIILHGDGSVDWY